MALGFRVEGFVFGASCYRTLQCWKKGFAWGLSKMHRASLQVVSAFGSSCSWSCLCPRAPSIQLVPTVGSKVY